MSIRLFLSDIDGTLATTYDGVSERSRRAIRLCEERDVPFVIVSGRWLAGARAVSQALGQKKGYMIVANGGAVAEVGGAHLREWLMPEEDARRVYDVLRKYPVAIHAYARKEVHRLNTALVDGALAEKLDRYLHTDGDCVVYRDDPARFEAALAAAYKLEVYTPRRDLLPGIREELTALGVKVESSGSENLEITMPGMGKGTAVRWLMAHLGVEKDECMAFGDNTNDLSMMTEVGWPVAVGNAAPELRMIARIVAPRCDEDGVARTIEKVLEGRL